MHDELTAEGYDLAVVGVNEAGEESGNASLDEAVDLPWLQDTAAVDAWGQWGAQWRDLYLLDGDGVLREAPYNLFDHDLSLDEDYAELRAMIVGLLEG